MLDLPGFDLCTLSRKVWRHSGRSVFSCSSLNTSESSLAVLQTDADRRCDGSILPISPSAHQNSFFITVLDLAIPFMSQSFWLAPESTLISLAVNYLLIFVRFVACALVIRTDHFRRSILSSR